MDARAAAAARPRLDATSAAGAVALQRATAGQSVVALPPAAGSVVAESAAAESLATGFAALAASQSVVARFTSAGFAIGKLAAAQRTMATGRMAFPARLASALAAERLAYNLRINTLPTCANPLVSYRAVIYGATSMAGIRSADGALSWLSCCHVGASLARLLAPYSAI